MTDREWRASHCVTCYPPSPELCEGCPCHDDPDELIDCTGFKCRIHDGMALVRKDDPAHDRLTSLRVCAKCVGTLAAMADDVGGE